MTELMLKTTLHELNAAMLKNCAAYLPTMPSCKLPFRRRLTKPTISSQRRQIGNIWNER